MPDALAVITKAIEEHHAIRGYVKLTGDTVNDIEALLTLRKAYSGWAQSSPQALIAKQGQLQQAISSLEEGLNNHFAFEEKAFPPLFGELLMKAILVEHRDIGRQIESAKNIVVNARLEGLAQPELLSRKSEIQQMINQLCQAVEEHASQEETILNMMKRALEERERK